MKHIKVFESKNHTEEVFKSNINWKFYNYLEDKLTEYEDLTGNRIEIDICVDDCEEFRNGFIIYHGSYAYDVKYSDFKDDSERMLEYAHKYGYFYVIYVNSDNIINKVKESNILYSLISNKSVKIDSKIANLVVQSK